MQLSQSTLSIAGSDSGGGAGIQADLKTISALQCYGTTVITALTAQNTTGVTEIYPVTAAFVEKQIEAVLTDIGADAVKIGMLGSKELIETVASVLDKYRAVNVVLDPVMCSQSGNSLITDDVADAYLKSLLPLTTVFTPNLPEASFLTGFSVSSITEMEKAARLFIEYGCKSVLLKGGHLDMDDCTDVLLLSGEQNCITMTEKRVQTMNNHGTGCTLSSAIAAWLAKGCSVHHAVLKAKSYITRALKDGAQFQIGSGAGPVHHFYDIWD